MQTSFDTIYSIPKDAPWKAFLQQLPPDELQQVLTEAIAVKDDETAAYAAELLKQCPSTSPA